MGARVTAVPPGGLHATSLRQLTPGDVVRFRVQYVGLLKQTMWGLWERDLETFADSVAAYVALVPATSQGALRVLDVTAVSRPAYPFSLFGAGEEFAHFDALVTDQRAPDMTLGRFVEALAEDRSAAEAFAIAIIPRGTSDSDRRATLRTVNDNANKTGGADLGASGSAPAPGGSAPAPNVIPSANPNDFFGEAGKYAGIVLALAALGVGAYFLRTFKD